MYTIIILTITIVIIIVIIIIIWSTFEQLKIMYLYIIWLQQCQYLPKRDKTISWPWVINLCRRINFWQFSVTRRALYIRNVYMKKLYPLFLFIYLFLLGGKCNFDSSFNKFEICKSLLFSFSLQFTQSCTFFGIGAVNCQNI